jgi:hypothetical protein
MLKWVWYKSECGWWGWCWSECVVRVRVSSGVGECVSGWVCVRVSVW